MAAKLSNNAKSSLAGALTAGATTLTVAAGQGARFPVLAAGDWFPLTIVQAGGAFEVVRATARTADTITIQRAQEGTTALAFADGAMVELRLTAGVLAAFQSDLDTTAGRLRGRNILINGNFIVQQRSFTFTSGAFGVDRWYLAASGISSSLSRQSTTVGTSGFNARVIAEVAKATLAVNDVVATGQRIEGLNAAHLKWGTAEALPVTLSFKARSNGFSGVVSVAIRDSNSSVSYVVGVPVSSTVSTHTVTIPGPTTGNFPTDNTTCFTVLFSLAAGSTYRTSTANQWQAGNFHALNTQVNGATTAGNWLDLYDVQLEVGSIATPFDTRPHGYELALCQRYYEVVGAVVEAHSSTGRQYHSIYFATQKRASPTLAWITQGGHTGTVLAARGLSYMSIDGLASINAAVAVAADAEL